MLKINSEDTINKIYLTSIGQYNKPDEKIKFDNDVEKYLDYIYTLYHKPKYILKKNTNHTFLNNLSIDLKLTSIKNMSWTLQSFSDMINKLKTRKFDTLTDNEKAIIYGVSEISISSLFNDEEQIPTHVKGELFDELYAKYYISERLKSEYRIKNIYYVPHKVDDEKYLKFTNKIELAHGTSNLSLLKILSEGFKRPSALKHTDTRLMGQSLGDGVYFARIDQMDKCVSYTDHYEDKYIIIADVYYNDEIKTYNYSYKNVSGTNLIHGMDLGAFSRDEYVVAPEQINIKYVIEIKER